MNILIYYQSHYHTVFLESLCEGFLKKGHSVQLLTTCPRGQLHIEMEKLGAKCYDYSPQSSKLMQFIKQFFYLIKFCRKNKIDVVYSHLQMSNLTAVLAQFFISSKVIPCRHHSNEVKLAGNKNANRIDKVINFLSRRIVVVSNAVKEQMVNHEAVSPKKIHVINLGYNFELYHKPDLQKVKEIRDLMNCKMILIVVSRMTASKRHIAAAQVLNNLIKKNLNVKMIMMDEGVEKSNIMEFLKLNGLENRVLFTGFVNNTMNYMAAADILVHPSIAEASNQVVKEAALLYKPSIVCKNVGDFDDYIINYKNGFIVDQNDLVNSMTEIIEKYYHKRADLDNIGSNIHDTVLERFAIDPVCDQYLKLAK